MLKNVDVNMIKWRDCLRDDYKAALFILERFYNEVDEWIEGSYPEGMDAGRFLDWVRFEDDDFIATFPMTWKLLYKNHLINEEDFINMEMFDGDEESLLGQLKDIPELREKVRQALIEEGRIEEDDFLPESIRSKRTFRRRNRR